MATIGNLFGEFIVAFLCDFAALMCIQGSMKAKASRQSKTLKLGRTSGRVLCSRLDFRDHVLWICDWGTASGSVVASPAAARTSHVRQER